MAVFSRSLDHSRDPDDRPPVIHWRLVVLLFAIAMVLRFAYFYLDDLTHQMSGTFVRRLLEEGTGNLASALLFPIAVLAERHFPVDQGRWKRTWLVQLGAYVAYSALHTSLLAFSRAMVFPAFGQGAYDYGVMSVRYFMESAQDAFSYAMFLTVLTLLRVSARLHAKDLRAAAMERDAANARLNALSLRLQPHFLFNALNTISSTVYDDPATADELLGRLGDLLRASLRTEDRHEISVVEELDVLHAYLALVEARFGDRLRVALSVDPATYDLAVPAFLLQPLVENAVRHGTAMETVEGTIDIEVSLSEGRLRLAVENDADEAGPFEGRIGTGLGTSGDRMRLLYGDAQSLEIDRRGRRFRVVATLPAHAAPPMPSFTPVTTPAVHARAHR